MHTKRTPVRTEWALGHELLTEYYDTEWGMPVTCETGLFERISLEAFQSGLSWLTILKRREAFRAAFAGFVPDSIAEFDDQDVQRLLADSSIIRNRRKIEATVQNARAVVKMRDEVEGGLPALIWSYMPETSPVFHSQSEAPSRSAESEALARRLKTAGFSMVGPTTMFALMGAVGIVDLHIEASDRRGCSGLWRRDGTRNGVPAPFSEPVNPARA